MIGLILANWKLVIIGLLLATIAGMGVYTKILVAQKDTLIAEKNVLVAELGVSQASVKSLQQAVVEQNAAVDKMKQDADERLKAGAVAVAKAKADSAVSKKRAEDLMKVQPAPGIPKCDAANDLFNQELKNAK